MVQDTYRIVIDTSKHLEALLEARGGTGRGLHEKLSSVEDDIAPEIRRAIRFVATIRNRVIHEYGYELSHADLQRFQRAADRAVTALGAKRAESAGDAAADGPNPWLDETLRPPKLPLKNVVIGIAATAGLVLAFSSLGSLMGSLMAKLATLAIYCLPAIIAHRKKHPDAWAILGTNLLFGWTGIGWVVAFVWTFSEQPGRQPNAARTTATGVTWHRWLGNRLRRGWRWALASSPGRWLRQHPWITALLAVALLPLAALLLGIVILAVAMVAVLLLGPSSREEDEDDIFISRPEFDWDSEDLVDDYGEPMPPTSPCAL